MQGLGPYYKTHQETQALGPGKPLGTFRHRLHFLNNDLGPGQDQEQRPTESLELCGATASLFIALSPHGGKNASPSAPPNKMAP